MRQPLIRPSKATTGDKVGTAAGPVDTFQQEQTRPARAQARDPLYQIRGLLRHGLEHLTVRQHTRLTAGLAVGDSHGEVELARACYQQLRRLRRAPLACATARSSPRRCWPACTPARSPKSPGSAAPCAWRAQVLAYFATDGLSNGGTEAINMLIEKARRLAHGYRNFDNYRLRMLLTANGTRTRRTGARPGDHAQIRRAT